MKENYQIRPAVDSDQSGVKCLLEELENRSFDDEVFSRIYTEYLNNKFTILYVVTMDNREMVGFISCKGQALLHHEGLVYEIQEMIVTAAHQGKGLGRKMIEVIRREVESVGAKALEVTSNKRRKEAHAFYQSVGFLNSHEKFTIYF